MRNRITKISGSARKFMQKRNISDVTFNLVEDYISCYSVRVVRDIQPVYTAPDNASDYLYCKKEGCHIFISRKIRIIGPLILTTEGLLKKRLYLCGTSIPI